MSIITDAITVVRAALLSNETIAQYCGTAISPVTIPEDSQTGDFILIAQEGYSSEWNQFDEFDETCHMLINATSTDYDRCLELAEAIKLELKKLYLTSDYMVEITDMQDDAVGYKETGQTRFVKIIKYDFGNIHKG